ncbi:Sensory domain found in PocR [Carpediemonas membranifera]|uniref:Sensory domain found in PocR n=1 Tax=Carpediemonas membranifera TaxID=201153 RepID=A0A8J6B3K5_9EUKA|nr:Sensory domain found in PocR [Carpediemonas membranifera]|eukprot:KAG9394983.1 Sensory domain found in PocR [Carpediemonas membranifera]
MDLEDVLAVAREPLPPVEKPPLRADQLDYLPLTVQRHHDFMEVLDEVFSFIQEPVMIQRHLGELAPFLSYDPSKMNIAQTDKSLETLFEPEKLQLVLDKFTEHAQCGGAFVSPTGSIIGEVSRLSTLCTDHVRATEEGARRCAISDQAFGSMSFDRSTFGFCHTGALTDGGSVIQLDGVAIASFLIGGVATSTPNVETAKIMVKLANDVGQPPLDVVRAFRRTRRMTMAQVQLLGESLHMLCTFLSQQASQNYAARRTARLESLTVDDKATNIGRNTIGDIMNSGLAAKLYALWWKPTDRVVPGWVYVSSVVALACGLLLPLIAAFSVTTPMSATTETIRDVLMAFVTPVLSADLPPWGALLQPLAIVMLQLAGPVTVLLALYNGQETTFNVARKVGRYVGLLMTTALLTFLNIPLGFLAARTPFRIIYIWETGYGLAVTFTDIIPDVLAFFLLFVSLGVSASHTVTFSFAPTLVSVHHLRELLLLSVHISVAFVGAAMGAVEFDDSAMTRSSRIAARVFAVGVSLASLIVSFGFVVATTIWVIGQRQKSFVAVMLGLTTVTSLVLFAGSVWSAVAFFLGYDDTIAFGTSGVLLALCLPLLVLAFVPLAVLHIRIRYAEAKVFAILFSETGNAAVKPFNLLRAVFKRGSRAASIRRVASAPATNLKLPDLANISVNMLELGIRPLVWHERKLFGFSGITRDIEYNLYAGANMLLRRACVAYSDDLTPPLRLTLLTISTKGAASIATSTSVLASISEECFSRTRLDQAMQEFAMRRYIEQMEHIYTLGGRDNAASFLEVQSKLSQARSHHLRTLVQVSKFWPLLLRRRPDLPLIIKHARAIGGSTNQANLLYTRLFRRYPDNPAVREWYILFLDSVMQDHARAQQLRTEAAEDDNKSNSSDESGSSFSNGTASTGYSAAGVVGDGTSRTFIRFLLAAAVVNVVLITGSIVGILVVSETMRTSMGTVSSLHDVNYALGKGTLYASMLHMNATGLAAVGLEQSLPAYLMESASAIQAGHDFLVDMTYAENEFYYFYRPDVIPITQRHDKKEFWAIAASLSNALTTIADTITSNSWELTSTDPTTRFVRAHMAVGMNLDSSVENLKTIQELEQDTIFSLVVGMALILALLFVVQLSITVVLTFWIIFRNFTAEVSTCDVSLTNCLSVSRAQVRRQMRLVGMAKSKFKDIVVADLDEDLQEDLNDDELTEAAIDAKLGVEEDDDGALYEVCYLGARHDDDDEAAAVPSEPKPSTERRVMFTEEAPETKSVDEEITSAFELAGPGSSGSEDKALSDVEDFLPEPPKGTLGMLADLLRLVRNLIKNNRGRHEGGNFHAIWSVLAIAGQLVAIVSIAVFVAFTVTSHNDHDKELEKTIKMLDYATISTVGPAVLDILEPSAFVVSGATDRLDAYIGRRTAASKAFFEVQESIPGILTEDSSIATHDITQDLNYYTDVAVSIAAYGYGYSSDITFMLPVSWNYTGETYYAHDVEEYSRSVWYTNKTSDTTTLAAADQLALAQAILFDDKVAALRMDLFANMLGTSELIPGFISELETNTLETFGVPITMVVVLALAFAPTVLSALIAGERRRAGISKLALVSLGCLVVCLSTMAIDYGVHFYTYQFVRPNEVAKDAAAVNEAFEYALDVMAMLQFAVQRYVFTGVESAFDMVETAVGHHVNSVARINELNVGVNQDDLAAVVAYHDYLYEDMAIALVLAASVHDDALIMMPTVANFTWNSTASTRPIDTTRFTNSTYDLARADADKLAMAQTLALTDRITYKDFVTLNALCLDLYENFRMDAIETLESTDELELTSVVIINAVLLLTMGFVAFLLLPTYTTAALSSQTSKRTQSARQQHVLNRVLRTKFTLAIALLLSVTAGVVLFAAVVIAFFTGIYFIYLFVSTTCSADSRVLMSGSRSIYSYLMPYSNQPAMLELELDTLMETVEDAFSADTLDLIFTGTEPEDLSIRASQYAAKVEQFVRTAPTASSDVRSGTLIPVVRETATIAASIETMFADRYARMSLVLTISEIVSVVGGAALVVVTLIVYMFGLRVLFRQLSRFSRSFKLLQSYLTH